jgi:hypothetical protein
MRLALAPKVAEVEEVEVAEAGVDEDTVAAAEVVDGVHGKAPSHVDGKKGGHKFEGV